MVLTIVVGLTLLGWWILQAFLPSLMPLGAGVGLFADAGRIGRPAAAPIMRKCISEALGLDADSRAEPGAGYFLLRIGGWQAAVFDVLRMSDERSEAESALGLATRWGTLAGCIYAQGPRELCDADNRAAAVEAATKFLLYARRAEPWLGEKAATAREARVRDAAWRRTMLPIKDRLLSTLRDHRRDGILVAADFGFFPPSEIRQAMGDEGSTRDRCK